MADPLDLGVPKQFQTDVETVHWVEQVNKILTGNRKQTSFVTDSVSASGAYVQAELQAVMDKLDEIILALKGG